MIDLSDTAKIRALDSSNVAGSIEQLGKQCQHAWEESKKLQLSDDFSQVDEVIVCGMGGSALPARIVEFLFADQLKVPILVNNTYELPSYANKKSLVVLSSYSGTTEEVLSCAKEAHKRGAKIVVIATGGNLVEMAQESGWPCLSIEPKYNPSNQPRMALGYAVISLLAILAKLGYLGAQDEDISGIAAEIEELNQKWGIEAPKENNFAKELACQLFDKMPIILGAEFLRGNIHAFANQLNENAKTFAVSFALPEANHHLMEGLAHPEATKELTFVLFKSNLYNERVQKRFEVTKDVILQNKIKVVEVTLSASDRLLQSFEVLTLGGWVSFYLAILNGINPAPIPWVDYFKKELSK